MSAAEDPLHPSALETAAYLFTTGYTKHKEKLVKFKNGDFKAGDPNEGVTTNLFEEHGLYVVYTWVKPSGHCVYRYQETNSPYHSAQLDFNKLRDQPPSVNVSVTGSYMMLTFPGAQGAFCAGSKPTDRSSVWDANNNFVKTRLTDTCEHRLQIKAFDQAEAQNFTAATRYMQAKFCRPLQTPPY